jgi:hypothetical protein
LIRKLWKDVRIWKPNVTTSMFINDLRQPRTGNDNLLRTRFESALGDRPSEVPIPRADKTLDEDMATDPKLATRKLRRGLNKRVDDWNW